MKGIVKFFNDSKGYGFILGDDNKDYFVHVSQTTGHLEKGVSCTFDIKTEAKGNQAINVRILDAPETKTSFVKIGDTSIKASNIKQYGISSTEMLKIPIYEAYEEKVQLWVLDFGTTIRYRQTGSFRYMEKDTVDYRRDDYNITWIVPFFVKANGKIEQKSDYPMDKQADIEVVNCSYLYVTSFQGNNYRFFDYEYDVKNLKKRMDALLS